MAQHTAESLLADYLWVYYPPEIRADPSRIAEDANSGGNPGLFAPLVEAAEIFVLNSPKLLGISLDFDPESVSMLSRSLDRETRDRLMRSGAPGEASGLFVKFLIHASAWLGEVVVRAHHGRWSLRRPLWESVVLRRHGGAVAPLHWLLKSLADDQVGTDSLSARFHVHVVLADASPDDFEMISPPKKLAALKRPTYDLFVKYLNTQVCEGLDLGEGFPGPGDFTARRYESMGFELMHGGRVLLAYGQTSTESDRPGVIELHWLTAHGLDHTDSLPCDPRVPCFARALDPARFEVTLSWQAQPRTHRLGFRGHA